MMSIGKIAGSKGYYENTPEGNYYLDDKLQSIFMGEGAKDLGLYGEPVLLETQEYLMKGILPTGETLTRHEAKHRSGYDLTFSAPKSVSVLSLVTGDTRLIDAHKKAVEVAIGEIEKFASVRTKSGSEYRFEQSNNLTVAVHTHDTSRELDPQLHSHALVFNLTKNSDDKWQSLSSDRVNKAGFSENIYSNQLAFGNIYQQTLRNEVENLGFETKNVGKNGLWEIEGVPTEEFSKRRQQITEEIGEDATAKERSIAAVKTRKMKVHLDKNELQKDWQDRLNKTGFNKDEFYQSLEPKNEVKRDDESVNNLAVEKAISLLSDEKTIITYQNLLNTSLSLSANNKGVIDDIKKGIELAITNNYITPIDKEKSSFISKVNLDREKNIVELTEILGQKKENSKLDYHSQDKGINDYFNSGEKIGIIEGEGNTLTNLDRLNDIRGTAERNNKQPVIIVGSLKLQKELNKYNINDIYSINQLSKETFKKDDLLIIPNAENLTLKQMSSLLEKSRNEEFSITFLDGKGKIGQGNSLDILKDNNVKTFNFTSFNKSNVNVEIVTITDQKERYSQLAVAYAAHQKNEGNGIVIANNKQERIQLTTQIREELKNKDLLAKEEISMNVIIPKYLNQEQRLNIGNYKKSMILEKWDQDNKKMQRYEITGVDKNLNMLYLKDGKDESVRDIKSFDSSWSLLEKSSIKIAKNEKLIAVGRVNKGQIKTNEGLTVTGIKDRSIIAVDEAGKKHTLNIKDEHKIQYDYVKSSQSTINHDKIVFSALSNRDMTQNTLNELIKNGDNIRIFSPISFEKTQQKLNNLKHINIISNVLKGEQYNSVELAITGRKQEMFTEVQKAVNVGITVAQKSETFFSIHDAMSEALKYNHKIPIDNIHQEMAKRQKNGEIYIFDTVKKVGQNIAVSAETYNQEKAIHTAIAKGINQGKMLLNPEQMNNANLSHLTKGQQEATKHILTSKDQFIGIQGLAGVGKTTQLKSVIEQLSIHNPDVEIIGLAPTHKAVKELIDVNVNAQTISSFLVEAKQSMNSGESINFNNKIFLIDEGSMIGNKNTASLYELISNNKGRAIISGDSKQLLSIDSGSAFSYQQNYTDLKFSIMSDIVRQNEQLKPAVHAILSANAREAINVLKTIDENIIKRDSPFINLGNVLDGKEIKEKRKEGIGNYEGIVDYIAKDYASREVKERDNTIIMTQLNTDKDAINKAVHDELRQLNKIGGVEHGIAILTPISTRDGELDRINTYDANVNNIALINKEYYSIDKVDLKNNIVSLKNRETGVISLFDPTKNSRFSDISLYKEKKVNVSEGDKIAFNRTDQDKGFPANVDMKIDRISQNILTLIDPNNETKKIDLTKDNEIHFDLSYAKTDYGVQGASSKSAIVYEKSAKSLVSTRSSYVGISRAKEHVTFITNDLDQWLQNTTNITDRISATQIIESSDNINRLDDIIRSKLGNSDLSLDDIKNSLNNEKIELTGEIHNKINKIIELSTAKVDFSNSKDNMAKTFVDNLSKEIEHDRLKQNELNIAPASIEKEKSL